MATSLRCPRCQAELDREVLGLRYEHAETEIIAGPDGMGFAFVPDEDATIDCPQCGKAMNRFRAARGDFDIGAFHPGRLVLLVALIGAVVCLLA